MKKLLFMLLALAECAAFPGISAYFFLKIRFIDLVYHFVGENGDVSGSQAAIPLALVMLVSFLALKRYLKQEQFERFALAATPLTALLILFFLPITFGSFILYIAAVSLTVFRLFRAFNWQIPDGENLKTQAVWIVFAAAAMGAAYGIFMQFDAMDRFYLGFSDWSVYAVAYSRFAGEPSALFPGMLNIGGHFNPLPNLTGTLLFALFDFPEMVFFLNSILIYSIIPAAYFCCRSFKLPVLHSLMFSLGLLLHFTPANLNLALFYGYHPSIFLPVLFLLGTGFAAQKRYKTAAVFFLLPLFVQETFAVFYFGLGLAAAVFCTRKIRWGGAAFSVLMIGWFFLCSRVLMTIGDSGNAETYQQMFHYSDLGRTVPEILLSPIRRPEVFFKDLFAVENFYFTGMLLAGFFTAFYPKLWMLTGILPALAGVFLLNGVELGNLAMQYQTEFFTLLAAVSAAGLAAHARSGERSLLSAAAAATLVGMFLCGIFAGRLPYGYVSYSGLAGNYPDGRDSITAIKKVIPQGAVIQSALGYQGHFIGRNELINFAGIEVSPKADFIIAPLRDFMDNRDHIIPRIQKLLNSPQYQLVYSNPAEGKEVWVFRKKQEL